jgi:hypothetical protein
MRACLGLLVRSGEVSSSGTEYKIRAFPISHTVVLKIFGQKTIGHSHYTSRQYKQLCMVLTNVRKSNDVISEL